MSVRVRFAPSPTGYLHVGGARTALYNYLFAKQKNGEFILRIEDTDKERSTDESIQAILDGLKWLNITWDEGPEKDGDFGPYYQSKRTDIYKPYIEKLLDEQKAFKCFCTKEELDLVREEQKKNKQDFKYSGKCKNLSQSEITEKIKNNVPYVIRIKAPEETITFNDLIRGKLEFTNSTFDDFIIARNDGSPVYNFVVTVDDLTMKISHVIRGEDHISNTPKQIIIYNLLGEKHPEYAHIPLILGKDKKRLSKRHGATSTDEYRKTGYNVEGFVNYLALLGWSLDDKTTVLSRDELIKSFSLDRVSKSGAVFDEEKLKWMSGLYIREMEIDELYEKCLPYLKEDSLIDENTDKEYLKRIINLVKERLNVYSDITNQIDFFLKELEYDKKARKNLRKADIALLEEYKDFITTIEFKDAAAIENNTNSFLDEKGLGLRDIVFALRASITFKSSGPSLFDIMYNLGKNETLKRLEKGISYAKENADN